MLMSLIVMFVCIMLFFATLSLNGFYYKRIQSKDVFGLLTYVEYSIVKLFGTNLQSIVSFLYFLFLGIFLYYLVVFLLSNIIRKRFNKNKNIKPFCFLLALWSFGPIVGYLLATTISKSIIKILPITIFVLINLYYSLYYFSCIFRKQKNLIIKNPDQL